MTVVSVLDAESNFSRLIHQIETGEETEIVIARDGKPAARLVAVESVARRAPRKLGLFEGRYATYSQEDFDSVNAELATHFGAE